MARITFVLFALGFLLFRPYQLHSTGMLYGQGTAQSDDSSYMAHALSIAELEFPYYTNQAFAGGESPMHSIGPGLLAAPFVAIANCIDRLGGDPRPRTYDVLRKQWAPFGFLIASIFYLWLACWLLYDAARRGGVSDRAASWSVILLILIQGAPLYVFRRPIFSHTYELLIQSAMVWLFVLRHTGAWSGFGTLRGALWLGELAGLMCLVRYNNVPLAGAWLLLFALMETRTSGRFPWRNAFAAGGVVVLTIAIFKLLPTLILGREKYAIAIGNFVRPFDPAFLIGRLFQLFAGLDWGLVFTAPFLLLGLFLLLRKKNTLERPLLWLLPVFLINLYLVLVQGYQGGYYGYRFLIFSLLPLAVLPLARWLDSVFVAQRKWPLAALCAVALLPLFSMLFFEGNASTLTLKLQRIEYPNFVFSDWDNKNYQAEVWKTLASPKEGAIVLAKGGPAFLIHSGASVIGLGERLPEELRTRYRGAGAKLFFQTLLVWLLPWMLWGVWRWKQRRHTDNRVPPAEFSAE